MNEPFHRLINGIRKVAAGLRPFSESVWPGVRNDLFVAHESIYSFASQFAAGCDGLDAGCGTGYGSSLLASSGARSVLGVDIDPRNIAYARKHYRDAMFEVADLERLPSGRKFGFAIASNSLEHLSHPAAFLAQLRTMLDGKAIIAVPPIYSEHDAHTHAGIHYHRSNLTVAEWARLIRNSGFLATAYIHWTRATPDFQSHRPSTLTREDFTFEPVAVETLLQRPTITAIFLIW